MARRHQPKDSRAAFGRGVVFGIGGAVIGMALYAGLVILSHGIVFGYFSFAVGYIVGKAMMMGSKRIGGRRYQITAVILTYLAVSATIVPVLGFQYLLERHPKTAQEQLQDEQREFEQESGRPSASAPKPTSHVGVVILTLLAWGLTSPLRNVLESPGWGLLGLVILYIGLQIAWKITQGRPALDVEGPFGVSAPKLV